MSWPASIFSALLTGLLALFVGGFIAAMAVDWYNVPNREGESGYFVITIAILSFGTRLAECLMAADRLSSYGLSATVADARFAKPLDEDLIRRLAREHEVLISIEEGAVGGFASHVLQFLALNGLLDRGLKVRPMVLPDRFLDQDTPEKMYEAAGLDANGIVSTVLGALGREQDAASISRIA